MTAPTTPTPPEGMPEFCGDCAGRGDHCKTCAGIGIDPIHWHQYIGYLVQTLQVAKERIVNLQDVCICAEGPDGKCVVHFDQEWICEAEIERMGQPEIPLSAKMDSFAYDMDAAGFDALALSVRTKARAVRKQEQELGR